LSSVSEVSESSPFQIRERKPPRKLISTTPSSPMAIILVGANFLSRSIQTSIATMKKTMTVPREPVARKLMTTETSEHAQKRGW